MHTLAPRHPAQTLALAGATLLVIFFAAALVLGGPLGAKWFASLNAHGHAQLHAHGHPFVDARSWLGIPNAMDVLSNLPFALFGYWVLRRAKGEAALRTLGVGLVLTAVGSAIYHWTPTPQTLVADRLGMAVAFAGALSLATEGLLGAALAVRALALLLPSAALAAALPVWSGNMLPWLVVQFGGLAWLVLAACSPCRPAAVGVRWGWVVAAYVAAKLLELHDAELFALTGEWVSGHTLKHLAAAAAVWPILRALRR